MDPDEALRQLREEAARILEAADNEEEADATRMAELFQGLDEWVVRGGFLPKDWKSKK